MKRGYFETESTMRRPYVQAVLYMPIIGERPVHVEFLVDTGADRTVLSPVVGRRLQERYGLDVIELPQGTPSSGVGGQMETRLIEATLTMDGFSKDLVLPMFEPSPTMEFPDWMPSLLGRDIIHEFAFFMENSTDQVLFLDADEAAALNLPSG